MDANVIQLAWLSVILVACVVLGLLAMRDADQIRYGDAGEKR